MSERDVRCRSVVALLVGCVVGGGTMPIVSSAASVDRGNGFVDHGVCAAVARSRGTVATVDGDGTPVVLTWLADARGAKSMLVTDALTGKTQQVPTPFEGHDSPFAVILSSRNRFYSLCAHTFMEFDPTVRKFTFVAKASDRVAMSITEDDNGVIWAGAYPASHVSSFDPKTKTFTNYGALNKESWPQYPSSIAVDKAGWVTIGIGNVQAHIVALDPKTKKVVPINTAEERVKGPGSVIKGADGKVYGRAHYTAKWFELFEGRRQGEGLDKMPARARILAGSQESVFRNFPDGRRIAELNVPDRYVVIRQPKSKETKRFELVYDTPGSHVMSLVLGPDGKIYGSTGHPLRIFCYDPEADTMTNNGLLTYNGHWNAMAVSGGFVYGAQYGHGILWEYDPKRPWADRDKENPNPRRILQSQPQINRPHVLLAHPDGQRLIMAGTPGYGLTGGGMHIWNRETGEKVLLEHTDLIPDQATFCLETLADGNLIGGTTIYPGTGGRTVAKEAELYIFDLAKRKVIWREAILPGTAHIRDIIRGPDGLIYGLGSDPTFFVFDPATRKVVHKEKFTAEQVDEYGNPSGGQAPRAMVLGPDKKLYVTFAGAIFRIEPGTFKRELLAKPPTTITIGIVLRQGRLYFTDASHLWSYKVPGL